MAYLETYQSNAAEVPVMRKWLVRMFVVSLLLHGALIGFFRVKTLDRFSPMTERLVPRAFSVQRLDVDPKLLENESEAPQPATAKTPEVKPIDLPEEKPNVDKIADHTRVTPVAPELARPVAMEKPHVEQANLQALSNLQQSAAREMESDLKSISKNLIQDKPKSANSSLLKYSSTAETGAGNSDSAGMATASGRLDEMLGRGLQKGDAPLSLPGGALFEFGSAELKSEAIQQLDKLGRLIKKSPGVIFSIEGHSDSFGDEQTNYALSLQRAESVRQWLVQNMDVDPARIQVRGFGKSRLAVAPRPYDEHAQASIELEKARQARNRRVEIVFTFPRQN